MNAITNIAAANAMTAATTRIASAINTVNGARAFASVLKRKWHSLPLWFSTDADRVHPRQLCASAWQLVLGVVGEPVPVVAYAVPSGPGGPRIGGYRRSRTMVRPASRTS
jgi:hypothetical protein